MPANKTENTPLKLTLIQKTNITVTHQVRNDFDLPAAVWSSAKSMDRN